MRMREMMPFPSSISFHVGPWVAGIIASLRFYKALRITGFDRRFIPDVDYVRVKLHNSSLCCL